MRLKYLFIFLILALFTFASYGQTFDFRSDSNEETSTISLKVFFKGMDETFAKEFTIINTLPYTYTLKETLLFPLTVDVYRTGFQTKVYTVQKKDTDRYLIKIETSPADVQVLDDIFIQGKRKPFEVKKDTVTFRVEGYADGTERKIEEIIEKLPGVEINSSTGEINYNGKSIEAVTLDGDDLFGSNYTIGTRNINVDAIKSIDAIENYSANRLMKGFETDNKVALNLNLKNNKFDYSGSLTNDTGISDRGNLREDAHAAVLGITKKVKSFAVGSFNNISKNYAPSSRFTNSGSIDNLRISNREARAPRALPILISKEVPQLSEKITGSEFFTNASILFKINKKLKVRAGLLYQRETIEDQNSFINEIVSIDTTFITSDVITNDISPETLVGNISLQYDSGKNSNFIYDATFNNRDTDSDKVTLQNNSSLFTNALSEQSDFLNQHFLWTKKIGKSDLVQVALQHTRDNLTQTLNLTNEDENIDLNQRTQAVKNIVHPSVIFTKKTSKSIFKWKNEAFVNTINRSLISPLDTSNSRVESFYNSRHFKSEVLSSFNIKKFSFFPRTSINFIDQRLPRSEAQDFYLEARLRTNYNITNNAFVQLDLSTTRKRLPEIFLYSEQIIRNSRSTIASETSLELLESQNATLRFNRKDLFSKLIIKADVGYTQTSGAYLPLITIDENSSTTLNVFRPLDIKSYNGFFEISKYIPFAKITPRLRLLSNLSRSFNTINSSDLRENNTSLVRPVLILKSGYLGPFNFESVTSVTTITNESEKVRFENTSFTQEINLLWKIGKNFKSKASMVYHKPNTQISSNFNILAFEASYSKKNSPLTLSLRANNILNEKTFDIIQNTNFSTGTFQRRLRDSFYLIGVGYNF